MSGKYDALISFFIDKDGGGRAFFPKKIVVGEKIQTGDHYKLTRNGKKMILEKVE